MSHKSTVEKSKRDAYRTPYEEVNRTNLPEAYKMAQSLDPGLPENPTEGDYQRAVLGLARRVKELEHEWS
jgi:hypothetical protein